MELFEAIRNRHSYRGNFTDKKVSRDELKQIVEAGMMAPSGKNAETTHFAIIDDENIVAEINAMHPGNKAMQQAKAMIACVVDRDPEAIYEGYNFQLEDCAAAVENMLLAITGLGYASVWIDGWLRVEGRADKVGKLLNVPESKVVQILLPIGEATVEVRGPEKLPFEKRAAFNTFPA